MIPIIMSKAFGWKKKICSSKEMKWNKVLHFQLFFFHCCCFFLSCQQKFVSANSMCASPPFDMEHQEYFHWAAKHASIQRKATLKCWQPYITVVPLDVQKHIMENTEWGLPTFEQMFLMEMFRSNLFLK